MTADNSGVWGLLKPEEDSKGNTFCQNGNCCEGIPSLGAEISAMMNLMDILCPDGNDDEAETMENEAPHPALLNDLVLRHLASFLCVKDLLQCRLVCKSWNTAVCLTLQIRPTYLKRNIRDMNELTAAVETNLKFPFLGFQLPNFVFEGLLGGPMKGFLVKCSPLFKRLRLPNMLVDFRFASRLLKLLATYFSGIQVLDVAALLFPSGWSMNSIELKLLRSKLRKLCLPKLKRLILPSATEPGEEVTTFIGGLIGAAPQLQHIENFTAGLTSAVVSSRKLDLVNTMIFERHDMLLPILEVTLSPPYRLSHLEVETFVHWTLELGLKRAILDAFVTVLKASRETLKSLKMTDMGFQLEDLPTFPKLNSLHITGNVEKCSEAYRIFPADVSHIFPALNTVEIELKDLLHPPVIDDKARLAHHLKFFLWDEPLLSVTSLKVLCALEKHGLEFCGKALHNTAQLWIDWEACFRRKGSNEYRQEKCWDIWTAPVNHSRLEIRIFYPWTHKDFAANPSRRQPNLYFGG